MPVTNVGNHEVLSFNGCLRLQTFWAVLYLHVFGNRNIKQSTIKNLIRSHSDAVVMNGQVLIMWPAGDD